MFCKSYCAAVIGVDARIVQIEADVNDGMPIFQMVGYLNSEVREAKERVRSAIKNIGWGFPAKRVTVNISPADFKKEGTAYDLGIAVALLCSFGRIQCDKLDQILFAGELSLNGKVNSINGVLPIVLAAKERGFKYCIVPAYNVNEGAIVSGIKTIGTDSLQETVDIIEKECFDEMAVPNEEWKSNYSACMSKDFSDISGQPMVKRAAMLAIAGGHNMLMTGPPGSGKTMIAERLPGIMPGLTMKESIEVSKIYSSSGKFTETKGFVYERPFRAPHHSISPAGLIGGGISPYPGEISYAHRGVLFMDELTEFKRDTVELLRTPLEKKYIEHTRNNVTIRYPSDFVLVAAMNPCPCGYYPDKSKCSCTPLQINRYLSKLSYPLLDRIDIVSQVQSVKYANINSQDKDIYTTSYIRERVNAMRSIQNKRFNNDRITLNSEMNLFHIKKYCVLDDECKNFMENVFEKLSLSVRGYNKILKVARTIADSEECDNITINHLKEAVIYRSFDRQIKEVM